MAERGYGDDRDPSDEREPAMSSASQPTSQNAPRHSGIPWPGRYATTMNGAVPAPKILAPAATLANA